MLIADPDRLPKGAEATARRLFGLTKAEAAVALALMNGQRTSDIADKLYISQNTLRTHLKRLYAKAGVPGQAGLVRLLHRSLFDGPEEMPSDSRSGTIRRVKSSRPGNRSIP
jgi:DNA-binding CsgD family transcriptional regulator